MTWPSSGCAERHRGQPWRGTRGLARIGALPALDELKVSMDLIVGTSTMDAAVAGMLPPSMVSGRSAMG